MQRKPKIFISHCEKNMGPTDYASRIIDLIGCEPIIAEKMPKGSSSVLDDVKNNLNYCDAVVVIATADQRNGEKFSPSNGVSEELGILKSNEKFKGKFFVIIEDGVVLSAMNDIAWYTFSKNNYALIAEAILIELGSMGLFRNYYEMPGSELEIHRLMETLSSLRDLVEKKQIQKDVYNEAVEQMIRGLLIK